MTRNIILVVEPDPQLRSDILHMCKRDTLEFIGLESEEAALDMIWERGADITAIFVDPKNSDDLAAESLTSVLSRDWPDIYALVGEAKPNGVYRELSRGRRLPFPWTSSQVAEVLNNQ